MWPFAVLLYFPVGSGNRLCQLEPNTKRRLMVPYRIKEDDHAEFIPGDWRGV